MPLLDLLADPTAFKFESKTRRFGMDMPGGGDSGLPYIQFGIDDNKSDNQFKQYFRSNRMSLDFPIRGGSETQVLGETTESPTSAVDKLRIEKFLKDDPRGNTFLLKQRGLQLSNPKIQTGDAHYRTLGNSTPTLFQNTRVYNDNKNLIAQVATMGTGNHITRAGSVVNDYQEKYYSDVVGKERYMDSDRVQKVNRLSILSNLKLGQKTSDSFFGTQYSSDVLANANNFINFLTLDTLGISPNRDTLFSYLGGPGSNYGVGETIISRGTDTTEAADFELPDGTPMSDLAYTYEQIRNKIGKTTPNPGGELRAGTITNYEDYRTDLAGAFKGSWETDGRVDVKFYDGRVDKLNKIAPYNLDRSENPFKTDIQVLDQNGTLVTQDNRQDIIKFGFECLSNSSFEDNTVLLFRAYLASITDSNSAAYNGFKYMGRGENFYVYQGFDRGISFNFKIAIGSQEEFDSSYKKLNYLISQIYPDYSQFTNFMTAPLIRLTIGDYLYRVHGFLENVNVTIDQNSSWEISDGRQLPHTLDVAITFKPILNQLPRRGRGMNDVPNLIRQTDADETKDVVYTPTAATATQPTAATQSPAAANAQTNANDFVGPVQPANIIGPTKPIPPNQKQGDKNKKKQRVIKKNNDDNKTASTKSTNTAKTPDPKQNTGFPYAQVGSISQLGIPIFKTFNK